MKSNEVVREIIKDELAEKALLIKRNTQLKQKLVQARDVITKLKERVDELERHAKCQKSELRKMKAAYNTLKQNSGQHNGAGKINPSTKASVLWQREAARLLNDNDELRSLVFDMWLDLNVPQLDRDEYERRMRKLGIEVRP